MKLKRKPRRFTDIHAKKLVAVPLAGNVGEAVLYESDFDKIRALGFDADWFLNSNGQGQAYVRTTDQRTRNNVTVACIIAGATGQQLIRYRDGNRKNLRSDNLLIAKGREDRMDCSVAAIEAARVQTADRQPV